MIADRNYYYYYYYYMTGFFTDRNFFQTLFSDFLASQLRLQTVCRQERNVRKVSINCSPPFRAHQPPIPTAPPHIFQMRKFHPELARSLEHVERREREEGIYTGRPPLRPPRAPTLFESTVRLLSRSSASATRTGPSSGGVYACFLHTTARGSAPSHRATI